MLEIAKTSTLGMIIVCRNCRHAESSEVPESDIWIDGEVDGDVYYQGENKESLAAFIFHHG